MAINLTDSLRELSDRYDRLNTQFRRFADLVAKLADPAITPVSGISVAHEVDENKIIVKFANEEIVLHFNLAVDERLAAIGRINCFVKQDFPDSEYTLFDSLDFYGDGHTDYPVPTGSDPLFINSTHQAIEIALNTIRKALLVQH